MCHEADDFGAAFSDCANRRFPIIASPRSALYVLVPPGFTVNAGERLVIGNTGPAGLGLQRSDAPVRPI